MAQTIRFRNPLNGQYVSPNDVADLEQSIRTVSENGVVVDQQILSFGAIAEDLTQGAEPNWTTEFTKWGAMWNAGDDPLNLSALQDAEMPEGAYQFRIIYNVDGNPDYPGRIASTSTLFEDQWPPRLDVLDGISPSSINRIVFKFRPQDG